MVQGPGCREEGALLCGTKAEDPGAGLRSVLQTPKPMTPEGEPGAPGHIGRVSSRKVYQPEDPGARAHIIFLPPLDGLGR